MLEIIEVIRVTHLAVRLLFASISFAPCFVVVLVPDVAEVTMVDGAVALVTSARRSSTGLVSRDLT